MTISNAKTSHHDTKFSPFQKSIIKELNKLCSPFIPFRIKKANNNHVQIFIDNCNVIGISSTPSDYRAKKQALSQIKRELTARHKLLSEDLDSKDECHIPNNTIDSNPIFSGIKAMKYATTYIMKNIDKIKNQELEFVLNENDIDALVIFRTRKTQEILDFSLNKISEFNPDLQERNLFIVTINNHLAFHLPKKAEYADHLKQNNVTPKMTLEANKIDDKKIIEDPIKKECEDSEPKDPINENNPITTLLNVRRADRVKLLRCLTDSDAKKLIEDINFAIQKNRETCINRITELMITNGVSLNEVQDSFLKKTKK